MIGELDLPASHAWALRYVADDPEVRLRDVVASRGITERSAYGTVTVTDLAEGGYVVKQTNGRRNRCQTRAHLPPPEPNICYEVLLAATLEALRLSSWVLMARSFGARSQPPASLSGTIAA